jgi:hypothetical protein
VIPFENSGLSVEYRIHKKLIHAVDIHRKGMESVFIIIIAKCRNMEVINVNCYNISYYYLE